MQTDTENRSIRDYVILALKGFCMGASDVVPGVSGGTMAFILGIYEDLINAIKSVDLRSLQLLVTLRIRMLLNSISWKFLLALGLGILTAIFTLARVLEWLLQNRPVLVWSFFLGLILASVVSVSRRIEKWSLFAWVGLLGGMTGTYFFVGIVPVETPSTPWFIFLCGAVAICAMILPGISGSFMLVLLGKYQYVLGAVNNGDFAVLALVAAGACVGIVFFSRLLGWLLEKYHDVMVAVLTGLMLGSLRKVWPWKETVESLVDMNGKVIPLVQANMLPEKWTGEVTAAFLLMLAGLVIVIVLDRLGGR